MKGIHSVSRFFLSFFFFFVSECSVISAPFVEKTIFTLLYCFCSFVKYQLTIFVIAVVVQSLSHV